MRPWKVIAATVAAVVPGLLVALLAPRSPGAPADAKALRAYCGVYQWQDKGFIYLQIWNELTGKDQLVAFDESGRVRTLYPRAGGGFFTGPGAALATPVESQVEFQRDAKGRIASLSWKRMGEETRTARRVEIERREEVRFPSGNLQLAGTLCAPTIGGRHPAIILVHGSGPENREHMLPFARFLVRHGIAILGYDKRGVGGSTGDWKTAFFEELADDVVAAFSYLKTRNDIDHAQVGLLGVSQAGWIMPLAALRAKDFSFLISVSGAGVPAAETTIDHAEREMRASGMERELVGEITTLMKLQYAFARTGNGWEAYAAARERLAARMGQPPATFPASPKNPQFEVIRRLYLYDPAPALHVLRLPVLALFGSLDNNILADKNKDAWEAALRAGGNRDYTLVIMARANHEMFDARAGNNKEMPFLQGFAPEYFRAVLDWLAPRIRGFQAAD